jgi:hypothetical protein
LENYNIVLRQPIKDDIDTRLKLGRCIECVTMCGGNINKLGEFNIDEAITHGMKE